MTDNSSSQDARIGKGDYKKFREFAETRTENALLHIRRIGNLSNTTNYSYKNSDVNKIIKALKDELSETERKFKRQLKNGQDTGFKL